MPTTTLRLHWATAFDNRAIGNAYGYRIHNDTLREYVSRIAVLTPDAEDVLFITSPEFYQKLEGKRNWLFTMFEGTTLPSVYHERIGLADCLLAPSEWVKQLLVKYFPEKPIFVVNHGVTPDFRYISRRDPLEVPNKKFRFLWVGAPNPRKGWEEVIYTWTHGGFLNVPNLELYLKTTRTKGIQRKGNIILDGRDLSRRELIKLYHNAHCFLFPTRGEGFGLTLAEAMRTGLPCIATEYSGVNDFFDAHVGYPIPYKMGKGKVTFIGDRHEEETEIAFPDVTELVKAMTDVVRNYQGALEIGKAASKRISHQFTWERAAETLVNHIITHKDSENGKLAACG